MAKLTLVASLLAAVIACEEPKEIGLAPTNEVGVLYTDTLTITRTTIQLDSVRSNDQGTLLVGRYTDPVFGQVQARAYAQLRQTAGFVVTDSGTANVTLANRIILDSTRLFMTISQSWYGDTTAAHELVVTRTSDSLRTHQLYDISSVVPVSNQVIARRTIRPRPLSTDSLIIKVIPLDKSIGQELLALANTDASKLTSSGTFVDPNGFRKVIARDFQFSLGGTGAASVLGLSPSNSLIAIYYHVQGEKSPKYQTFSFEGKRFNQITYNRGGTALAALRPGQSQPTTVAGRTYVQPGTGMTTKLQFPTLLPLLQSGRIAVNRADLVITPQPGSDGTYFLPPYMALTEVDAGNRLLRSDLSTGAVRLFMVQRAAFSSVPGGPLSRLPNSYLSPQVAVLDPRTNSYTFQLSGYMQSILTRVSPNNALAILTPSYGTIFEHNQSTGALIDYTQSILTDRVWRMVLDGKASVKLILFYTKSN